MRRKRATGGHVHIGGFARANSVSIRTIRYYEELGLIQPPRRSRGGFRLYGEESQRRMRMISVLKEAGIPLTEIRAIFEAKHSGEEPALSVRKLRSILVQKASVVDERISELGRVKSDLDATIRLLGLCGDCRQEVLLDQERCGSCSRVAGRDDLPDAFRVLLQA